jgi:hypothetical protein
VESASTFHVEQLRSVSSVLRKYEVYLTLHEKFHPCHGTICEKVEASSVKEAIAKAFDQCIYCDDVVTGVLVYQ